MPWGGWRGTKEQRNPQWLSSLSPYLQFCLLYAKRQSARQKGIPIAQVKWKRNDSVVTEEAKAQRWDGRWGWLSHQIPQPCLCWAKAFPLCGGECGASLFWKRNKRSRLVLVPCTGWTEKTIFLGRKSHRDVMKPEHERLPKQEQTLREAESHGRLRPWAVMETRIWTRQTVAEKYQQPMKSIPTPLFFSFFFSFLPSFLLSSPIVGITTVRYPLIGWERKLLI